MRTTIDIPDELLAEAKERAAREGRTLSAVVGDAVRSGFGRAADASSTPVRLTTFQGDGVRPGIDLDNTAALLELMERSD